MPIPVYCRCGHADVAHERPWADRNCRICPCLGFEPLGARDAPPIAVLVPALLEALSRGRVRRPTAR